MGKEEIIQEHDGEMRHEGMLTEAEAAEVLRRAKEAEGRRLQIVRPIDKNLDAQESVVEEPAQVIPPIKKVDNQGGGAKDRLHFRKKGGGGLIPPEKPEEK